MVDETKPAPMDAPKDPKSGTEIQAEKEVLKEKMKAVFPTDSIVAMFLDFMDLENLIKEEYAAANVADKKKMIRWFSMGLMYMFVSMIVSLIALQLWDILGVWPTVAFFVEFIAGTAVSLGLGYYISKFKDTISVVVKDREHLERMLKSIAFKLSK